MLDQLFANLSHYAYYIPYPVSWHGDLLRGSWRVYDDYRDDCCCLRLDVSCHLWVGHYCAYLLGDTLYRYLGTPRHPCNSDHPAYRQKEKLTYLPKIVIP